MSDASTKTILSMAASALSAPPQLLSLKDIQAFVDQYLARRDAFLNVANLHGSPLYVLDHERIEKRAWQFRIAFEERLPVPVSVYYAMKSNNCPLVAEKLLTCGLGLDVSSGKELKTALELGAEKIVFSGPGKTDFELTLAMDHTERVTVLLDSFSELEKLSTIASRRHQDIRAGVRLTPNPQGLWRKFGIPLSQLQDFISLAKDCSRVRLVGLQFHSSWNLSAEAQCAFIAELGHTLRQLPSTWVSRLEFVDIGGGYWPEQGEWLQDAGTTGGTVRKLLAPATVEWNKRHHLLSTPIGDFADKLATAIQDNLVGLADLSVYLEPGRWLSHESMHLLMTVVDRKASDVVITNAGTNAVGWERFETDFFPVINLTRPGNIERRCDVHGCLCTPHDIWGYSVWGQDICQNDILLIPCQGAYTYSLRQDFIKDIPKVAILEQNSPAITQ